MRILFLLFFYIHSCYSLKCHKCASTDAVWNWVKYGLPVSEGDSMISDDKCLEEEKLKKEGVTCSGSCMTINITRIDGEHPGKTIAMVRDCGRGKHLEIGEGQGAICEWHEKRVNRRKVNITTCYCLGQYCNGKGSAKALSNSKSVRIASSVNLKTPRFTFSPCTCRTPKSLPNDQNTGIYDCE